MPCDCKTNKNLLSLANLYGSRGLPKKSVFGIRTNNFFYSIFVIFFIIIAAVPLFIYFMFKGLFSKDKGVHFDKIFNLRKNV